MNSNLIDCITGRSPGFSPLRIQLRIDAGLTIGISNARSVAHQPTRSDELPQVIEGGDRMFGRQRNQLFPMRRQKRSSTDQHGTNAALG